MVTIQQPARSRRAWLGECPQTLGLQAVGKQCCTGPCETLIGAGQMPIGVHACATPCCMLVYMYMLHASTASLMPVALLYCTALSSCCSHGTCPSLRCMPSRRVTPGVLLVSSRPTTPARAAHSLPLTPQSPGHSTHAASPLSVAVPGAYVTAKAVDVPDADEILILDDEPDSPAQQPTFLQPGHQAGSSSSSSSSNRAQTPPSHGVKHAGAMVAAAAAAAAAAEEADSCTTNLKPTDVYSSALYKSASGSRSRVASAGSVGRGPVGDDEALGLDEVLRLDEDDVLAAAPSRPSSSLQYNQQHQQHLQQQQQQQQLGGSAGRGASAEAGSSGSSSLNLGSSRPGALQVASRPGSAPTRPGSAYRPGTPLKSCLRNSPSTSLTPTGTLQLRTP
jgi:hypothetical protein